MKQFTNLSMRLLGLAVALMSFITAFADNKLSIADFNIVPGEEKTVSIVLDNTDPISSIQLDLKLPEGLEYVDKSLTMNEERLDIHSAYANYNKTTSVLRIMVLHEAEDLESSAFKGEAGEILSFKVKAAATYKSGKIAVTNVKGSDGTLAEPKEIAFDDFEVAVNANPGTFSLSEETISAALSESNTASVSIAIKNNVDIAGMQADIVLPRNLIVESFTKGERVPGNYKVKPTSLDASGTITLSSLMVEAFEGTEGDVLTLNLKAVGPVKGQLVVKNVMIADLTGATAFVFEEEKSVNVEFAPESADLSDGDYLIKNVATGKYLGGANAWGTKASIVDDARIFTLAKLENGKYSFDSHAYNSADKHFLNGEWTDGDASEISIFKTEAGLSFGTAIDACYAPKAEGTELTVAGFISDDNAAWEFISVADVVAALEVGEATDATFLLKDASISRNLYNPSFEKVWEGDSFAKGGPNENQNAEKWGGNSQTFDAYQTINVPNGIYTVSVQGYYRYNNTDANTNDVAIAAHADGTEVIYSFLYANGKEVPFASIADDDAAAALEALPFSQADAAAAFAQGLYNNSVEVVVTDGTLTVGVKKTEHIGWDWTVWDNFTLTRTGDVPALAKVEKMTLSVAEDAVIDEDGTFPVVFGYTATVDESLTMPAGSISYTVTAEGKEPINGETDFDVDKDARNIYIAGLEYGTEYTIAINSLSVSYFDLETGESKVVFEQKFEAGELTATFTTNAKPEEPEPIEPDAWYIADKFKVNEYIDGNRVDVATARFVADPTNAENGCIEVITNDNAAETWNAQLFVVSDVEFAAGDVVSLEMKVRADRAQTSDTQLHKNPGEYVHWQAVGNVNFTTEWTAFAGTVTIDASWPTGMKTIAFNLSEKAGQSNRIYFDDVKLTVTKPDGINGVNAGAKANRKVRVNGQIMIIKNGQKSTVSGVTLK